MIKIINENESGYTFKDIEDKVNELKEKGYLNYDFTVKYGNDDMYLAYDDDNLMFQDDAKLIKEWNLIPIDNIDFEDRMIDVNTKFNMNGGVK